MSLAPRFLILRRDVGKAVRLAEEVSKAARSAIRRAGLLEMVPSREMRRPAWSEFRSRVSWNWGIRDSTCAATSGGVVDVMAGCMSLGKEEEVWLVLTWWTMMDEIGLWICKHKISR
jgi:hypothetical protein